MSERKIVFDDYCEMAHIWARIQAFDQVFKIHAVQIRRQYHAKD